MVNQQCHHHKVPTQKKLYLNLKNEGQESMKVTLQDFPYPLK